jgi:hypothetical protein
MSRTTFGRAARLYGRFAGLTMRADLAVMVGVSCLTGRILRVRENARS